MRKLLPRDVNNETVRENGEKVYVLPNEIVFRNKIKLNGNNQEL